MPLLTVLTSKRCRGWSLNTVPGELPIDGVDWPLLGVKRSAGPEIDPDHDCGGLNSSGDPYFFLGARK
ncbi:hypothetical protein P3X46_019994, partial [Hevea brasiliensis]